MIVAADRVPAAIIQHVATDVVLDALPDPVAVVSLGAHAPVATLAGRNALRVHVALGRIGRAIGHHAAAVHHAESRIARALVARAGRVVRASLVLQTVGTAAAFVCIEHENEHAEHTSTSTKRNEFRKTGNREMIMLRVIPFTDTKAARERREARSEKIIATESK